MVVDPSKLCIIEFPDPRLRAKAETVDEITPEIRDIAARMIELMDAADGIGLAAPQIALGLRMFVTRVPEQEPEDEQPVDRASIPVLVYINPVLSSPDGPLEPMSEGCLSIPEICGEVNRPRTITIEALDIEGRPVSRTASGLIARCWQHEFDHLEGILILDRFTQMSRLRNRAAIRALEREAGIR